MVSIVTCSISPDRYAAVCRNLRDLLGPEPHEFIGIHDARSLSEGYNRGIRQSRGEVILLCHDDIEILAPDFRQKLLSRLARFDLIGVAGSTRLAGPKWAWAGPPYIYGQVAHPLPDEKCYQISIWSSPSRSVPNIKVMDGVLLAGKRDVFQAIPFDERTFDGFHLYDLDFTCRAAMAGFKLAVCNDLMLIHCSQGNWDDSWKAYARRFVEKHRAAFQPTHRHRWWSAMRVKVDTKEEVIELLGAPIWPE